MLLASFILVTIASLSQSQDPIGCFVPGECLKSLFVGISSQNLDKDCLKFCKESPDCNYFTHYKKGGACYAFSNCVELNNTICNDCVSGDVTCKEELCFKPGFCTGTLVNNGEVPNENECLKLCQESSECSWFSFRNGFCSLTSDCLSVENCNDCVYGQSSCEIGSNILSHLVVVGGISRGDFINSTEFIDLESSNTTSACPGLPNFPVETGAGFALRRNSGEIMVCGGLNNRENCLYLNDHSWIPTDNLLYGVYAPAVVDIGNGEQWIVGGEIEYSQYYKNGMFIRGPDLPDNWKYHCALKLNETHYFFVGADSRSDPFVYDNSTGLFVNLDTGGFTFGMAPSCGLINEGREIVVAGGLERGFYLSNVQILDLQSMTWRKGPNLPEERSYSSSLPYNGSFIVVGGYANINNVATFYDDVLFFDLEIQGWVRLPGKMENGRDLTTAMLVSRQEVDC